MIAQPDGERKAWKNMEKGSRIGSLKRMLT